MTTTKSPDQSNPVAAFLIKFSRLNFQRTQIKHSHLKLFNNLLLSLAENVGKLIQEQDLSTIFQMVVITLANFEDARYKPNQVLQLWIQMIYNMTMLSDRAINYYVKTKSKKIHQVLEMFWPIFTSKATQNSIDEVQKKILKIQCLASMQLTEQSSRVLNFNSDKIYEGLLIKNLKQNEEILKYMVSQVLCFYSQLNKSYIECVLQVMEILMAEVSIENFEKGVKLYESIANNREQQCHNFQILINRILKSPNIVIFFSEITKIVKIQKFYIMENIFELSLIVIQNILKNQIFSDQSLWCLKVIESMSYSFANIQALNQQKIKLLPKNIIKYLTKSKLNKKITNKPAIYTQIMQNRDFDFDPKERQEGDQSKIIELIKKRSKRLQGLNEEDHQNQQPSAEYLKPYCHCFTSILNMLFLNQNTKNLLMFTETQTFDFLNDELSMKEPVRKLICDVFPQLIPSVRITNINLKNTLLVLLMCQVAQTHARNCTDPASFKAYFALLKEQEKWNYRYVMAYMYLKYNPDKQGLLLFLIQDIITQLKQQNPTITSLLISLSLILQALEFTSSSIKILIRPVYRESKLLLKEFCINDFITLSSKETIPTTNDEQSYLLSTPFLTLVQQINSKLDVLPKDNLSLFYSIIIEFNSICKLKYPNFKEAPLIYLITTMQKNNCLSVFSIIYRASLEPLKASVTNQTSILVYHLLLKISLLLKTKEDYYQRIQLISLKVLLVSYLSTINLSISPKALLALYQRNTVKMSLSQSMFLSFIQENQMVRFYSQADSYIDEVHILSSIKILQLIRSLEQLILSLPNEICEEHKIQNPHHPELKQYHLLYLSNEELSQDYSYENKEIELAKTYLGCLILKMQKGVQNIEAEVIKDLQIQISNVITICRKEKTEEIKSISFCGPLNITTYLIRQLIKRAKRQSHSNLIVLIKALLDGSPDILNNTQDNLSLEIKNNLQQLIIHRTNYGLTIKNEQRGEFVESSGKIYSIISRIIQPQISYAKIVKVLRELDVINNIDNSKYILDEIQNIQKLIGTKNQQITDLIFQYIMILKETYTDNYLQLQIPTFLTCFFDLTINNFNQSNLKLLEKTQTQASCTGVASYRCLKCQEKRLICLGCSINCHFGHPILYSTETRSQQRGCYCREFKANPCKLKRQDSRDQERQPPLQYRGLFSRDEQLPFGSLRYQPQTGTTMMMPPPIKGMGMGMPIPGMPISGMGMSMGMGMGMNPGFGQEINFGSDRSRLAQKRYRTMKQQMDDDHRIEILNEINDSFDPNFLLESKMLESRMFESRMLNESNAGSYRYMGGNVGFPGERPKIRKPEGPRQRQERNYDKIQRNKLQEVKDNSDWSQKSGDSDVEEPEIFEGEIYEAKGVMEEENKNNQKYHIIQSRSYFLPIFIQMTNEICEKGQVKQSKPTVQCSWKIAHLEPPAPTRFLYQTWKMSNSGTYTAKYRKENPIEMMSALVCRHSITYNSKFIIVSTGTVLYVYSKQKLLSILLEGKYACTGLPNVYRHQLPFDSHSVDFSPLDSNTFCIAGLHGVGVFSLSAEGTVNRSIPIYPMERDYVNKVKFTKLGILVGISKEIKLISYSCKQIMSIEVTSRLIIRQWCCYEKGSSYVIYITCPDGYIYHGLINSNDQGKKIFTNRLNEPPRKKETGSSVIVKDSPESGKMIVGGFKDGTNFIGRLEEDTVQDCTYFNFKPLFNKSFIFGHLDLAFGNKQVYIIGTVKEVSTSEMSIHQGQLTVLKIKKDGKVEVQQIQSQNKCQSFCVIKLGDKNWLILSIHDDGSLHCSLPVKINKNVIDQQMENMKEALKDKNVESMEKIDKTRNILRDKLKLNMISQGQLMSVYSFRQLSSQLKPTQDYTITKLSEGQYQIKYINYSKIITGITLPFFGNISLPTREITNVIQVGFSNLETLYFYSIGTIKVTFHKNQQNKYCRDLTNPRLLQRLERINESGNSQIRSHFLSSIIQRQGGENSQEIEVYGQLFQMYKARLSQFDEIFNLKVTNDEKTHKQMQNLIHLLNIFLNNVIEVENYNLCTEEELIQFVTNLRKISINTSGTYFHSLKTIIVLGLKIYSKIVNKDMHVFHDPYHPLKFATQNKIDDYYQMISVEISDEELRNVVELLTSIIDDDQSLYTYYISKYPAIVNKLHKRIKKFDDIGLIIGVIKIYVTGYPILNYHNYNCSWVPKSICDMVGKMSRKKDIRDGFYNIMVKYHEMKIQGWTRDIEPVHSEECQPKTVQIPMQQGPAVDQQFDLEALELMAGGFEDQDPEQFQKMLLKYTEMDAARERKRKEKKEKMQQEKQQKKQEQQREMVEIVQKCSLKLNSQIISSLIDECVKNIQNGIDPVSQSSLSKMYTLYILFKLSNSLSEEVFQYLIVKIKESLSVVLAPNYQINNKNTIMLFLSLFGEIFRKSTYLQNNSQRSTKYYQEIKQLVIKYLTDMDLSKVKKIKKLPSFISRAYKGEKIDYHSTDFAYGLVGLLNRPCPPHPVLLTLKCYWLFQNKKQYYLKAKDINIIKEGIKLGNLKTIYQTALKKPQIWRECADIALVQSWINKQNPQIVMALELLSLYYDQ